MAPRSKNMKRGIVWNEEVEDAFRFQLAGFRDATEYEHFHGGDLPDRWPNGLVKVLKLKIGYFYCYNRNRECAHKDIHCTKIYSY
ncbi:meiosis expressed gene 1 protein homolog [Sycon ciliatum]|uniref:meiosis expressed gene 1 protein homolog n=2 Tax=Sycon ciliatum TaxID=27933 RepID=UPI0031F717B9